MQCDSLYLKNVKQQMAEIERRCSGDGSEGEEEELRAELEFET